MTDALTTTPATYLKAAEDGHLGRMIEGEEMAGLKEFFEGSGRPSNGLREWQCGWDRAWAVCYAQGAIAGTKDAMAMQVDDLSYGDANPYPQFSAAWEAWAEGYDDYAAGGLG